MSVLRFGGGAIVITSFALAMVKRQLVGKVIHLGRERRGRERG